MKTEILAGTPCDVCGSWEFECREEQLPCVTCQLPAADIEVAELPRQDRETEPPRH